MLSSCKEVGRVTSQRRRGLLGLTEGANPCGSRLSLYMLAARIREQLSTQPNC